MGQVMEHPEIRHDHPEVEKIFAQQSFEICVRVDRAFFYLMLFQWAASILIGLLVTPLTWVGQFSNAWENGLVGVVFGGLFALPALYCIAVFPGQKVTRYVITVAQMCFSILLIYMTGGRIETHFHVFVSLAALAFYKDTHLLWLASSIVIVDHILRGILLPMSVYGEPGGVEWRWLEHAGWVVFEDGVLILGISKIRQELREMALSKFQLIFAREEALHFSKLKSNFLSNMSHEIRTPLNSIVGFSEILRDTNLDNDQKEYVQTIHRCSDTLLHLINDVLDISKIENGLLHIDKHRFDFKQLHEDIHKMFFIKCQEKGVTIELEMEETLPAHALGDSHRVRQILMNLVSNAVKFTERGRVRIEVKRDSKTRHYRWSVSDTGKGIKSENLHKLFRNFYQEDPSIPRKYGGSGLGLMITKNLVELMGGQISVNSKLGEGTTFLFSLPLDEA